MAKRDLVIVNDDDGGVTLSPANKKPDPKDSLNPIDADTGESTFDDMDSRFNMPAPKMAGQEDDEDDAETDAELDELFPADKKPKKAADEDEDEPEEAADEEPEPAEDEDEPEEEAEQPRGKGWKGRLAREQRLRREAEDHVRDLEARVDAIDMRENERASEAKFQNTQSELTAKITAKKAELIAAQDAGESAKVVDLIDELSDLKGELRLAKDKYDEAKTSREQRSTTANPIVLRKVDQWKRQHPRFERDPVFRSFVLGLDKEVNKRFNPERSDYYEELDRQIAERYPEEYKGRNLKPKERPQHPSRARTNEGGTRRPMQKRGEFEVSKDGRVKLSKMHVQTMKTFNLDPDNPEDVREFVRNNS